MTETLPPRPRLTARGWLYLIGFAIAPLLIGLLLLDIVLWAIFRFVFGSCYGILCLFD